MPHSLFETFFFLIYSNRKVDLFKNKIKTWGCFMISQCITISVACKPILDSKSIRMLRYAYFGLPVSARWTSESGPLHRKGGDLRVWRTWEWAAISGEGALQSHIRVTGVTWRVGTFQTAYRTQCGQQTRRYIAPQEITIPQTDRQMRQTHDRQSHLWMLRVILSQKNPGNSRKLVINLNLLRLHPPLHFK